MCTMNSLVSGVFSNMCSEHSHVSDMYSNKFVSFVYSDQSLSDVYSEHSLFSDVYSGYYVHM